MTQGSRPAALLAKAETAISSARTLLDLGDFDGASNRAYYAIFDAARAALLHMDSGRAASLPKTHSGLLNLFSEQLVLPGKLPKALGRTFKRAEEIRLAADYTDDPVEAEIAGQIVDQSEIFVAAIAGYVGSQTDRL